MHYLIDGYNLLFRVEQAEEELQVQREKLIRSLDEKFAALHLKGTLIFDAHLQQGEGGIEYAKNLDIFYTPHSQTADEAILDLLKGLKPASWIIVTSDKRLAWKVRCHGFKTEGIGQFLAWVKKRIHNKGKRREKYAPPLILPAPKKKTPSLQAIPEDCFDYYMEIFQREVEPEKPKAAKKKRVAIAPVVKPNEPVLSDFERWFKAFSE